MTAPMTNLPPVQLSDERLAEIAAGCEGVTPGPWNFNPDNCGKSMHAGYGLLSGDGQIGYGSESLPIHIEASVDAERRFGAGVPDKIAAHIARLDPQTVLSLVTELQHSRAEEAEGWVLVPRELTTDMIAAVRKNGGMQAAAFAIAAWSDLLSASPASPSPATGGVEQCLTIIDQMETEWRAKGWEDEATAACDIAARIKSALVEPSPATGARVKARDAATDESIADVADITARAKAMNIGMAKYFVPDIERVLSALVEQP